MVERKPWTDKDIKSTMSTYYKMLKSEKRGAKYNKAALNRDLANKIGRSRATLEFFHCNISAALDTLGMSYVKGYKPRPNGNKKIRVFIEKDDKWKRLTSLPEPEAPPQG